MRYDRISVFDTTEFVNIFVDEVADIGVVVNVEFDQKVIVACDRVDLRGDFSIGDLIGDLVGLAKFAFDHQEERDHFSSSRMNMAQAPVSALPSCARRQKSRETL